MIRLPRQLVASLALSLGSVVAGLSVVGGFGVVGGCSRKPIPILSCPPPKPAEVDQSSAPPLAFAVPPELAPLPTVEPLPAEQPSQPVQAQYAQAASPPAGAPAAPIASREESIYAPYVAARPSVPVAGPAASPSAQPITGLLSVPPGPAPAVAERTSDMIARATQMARKGMLFAAKGELTQALQFIADARDAQEQTTARSAALGAGFTALAEADDFPRGGDAAGIFVAEIARGHRTTILHRAGQLAPDVARQHYQSYAQQQLAQAAGGEPAASQALYTLGKIQMALAGSASQPSSGTGRAIVFFQAALMVDGRNYQAANELGVLLAREGQLSEARRALLHSVTVQPHVEGWQNLATVHRRLGETELAHLAENERQQLARQQPAAAKGADNRVTWVDARKFAAAGGGETGRTDPAARTAAAAPNNSQLR